MIKSKKGFGKAIPAGLFIFFTIILTVLFIKFSLVEVDESLHDENFQLLSSIKSQELSSINVKSLIRDSLFTRFQKIRGEYLLRSQTDYLDSVEENIRESCLIEETILFFNEDFGFCLEEGFFENIGKSLNRDIEDGLENELKRLELGSAIYLIDIVEGVVEIERREELSLEDIESRYTVRESLESIDLNTQSYALALKDFQNSVSVLSVELKNRNYCSVEKKKISECIKEILEASNNNKYSFKVLLLEDLSDEDYLTLSIGVSEGETYFETNIRLKNAKPLENLEYEVENSKTSDKTFIVNIDSTSLDEKDLWYYVFYSYDNFLLESKSQFIEILRDFDEAKFDNNGAKYERFSTNYFYSSDDSTLKLNLAKLDAADSSDINSPRVYINQIYEHESKSYELFDTNREVFFYTFAVKKEKFNILVDEEELEVKNLKAVELNSPTPIGEENIDTKVRSTVTTDGIIVGFQDYISFKIENYDSKKFSSHDLYLTKKPLRELEKNCQEIEECFYLSGSSIVTEKNPKVFISNYDFGTLNLEEDTVHIKSDLFRDNSGSVLTLSPGEEYFLYVVPVDISGNGVFKNIFSIDEFEFTNANYFKSIYGLLGPGVNPKSLKSFRVEISDNRDPSPEEVELGSQIQLNQDSNLIFLSWAQKVGVNLRVDEIENLNANIKIYIQGDENEELFSEGTVKILKGDSSSSNVKFSNGEDIILPTRLITRIEITDIYPVDVSGNFQSPTDQDVLQGKSISYQSS